MPTSSASQDNFPQPPRQLATRQAVRIVGGLSALVGDGLEAQDRFSRSTTAFNKSSLEAGEVIPSDQRGTRRDSMRLLRSAPLLLIFIALFTASVPATAHAQFGINISVGFAPPVLPVYVQPPCPEPNLLWTPGYWAY